MLASLLYYNNSLFRSMTDDYTCDCLTINMIILYLNASEASIRNNFVLFKAINSVKMGNQYKSTINKLGNSD